jgi:hypothetical protein
MKSKESGQQFFLDVYYTDASETEHTFFLCGDSRSMTWRLYDDRLGLVIGGKHGPPGINVPPSLGSITGTAFWRDNEKTICFALRDFLSIPYYAGKYSVGHEGEGVFVSAPPDFKLSSKSLRWVVATET